MMQRTYSRADGVAWIEDVLRAQREELDMLSSWLGEDQVQAARTAWRRRNYELAARLIDDVRQRGKLTMSEIENLHRSFRAEIAGAIARHRTIVGARAVDGFAAEIAKHVERYGEKISGLAAQGHDVSAAAAAIKADGDSVVARAYEAGRVEFED